MVLLWAGAGTEHLQSPLQPQSFVSLCHFQDNLKASQEAFSGKILVGTHASQVKSNCMEVKSTSKALALQLWQPDSKQLTWLMLFCREFLSPNILEREERKELLQVILHGDISLWG